MNLSIQHCHYQLSRVVLLLPCLVALTARAVQIVHVDKTFVIIDAGTDDGIDIGDTVCLRDDQDKEVGCGSVESLRKHYAGVKLDPLVASKLKKFNTADLSKRLSTSDQDRNEEQGNAGAQTHHLSVHYLYSLRTPFTYKIPRYDLNADTTGVGSLWRSDRLIQSSNSGARMSYSWRWGENLSLATGFSYRTMPRDTLLVDYQIDDPTIYLETITTASSMAIHGDAELHYKFGDLEVLPLAGFDFDHSMIQFAATQKGGVTNHNVNKMQSTMLTTSLRLGLRIQYWFGAIGLSTGATALLPAFGTAQTTATSGTPKAGTSADQQNSATSELKSSLAHRRNSWGSEWSMGLIGRF